MKFGPLPGSLALGPWLLAVRLQPKNAMAFENLGDVYVRLAGQAYDQANQINPRAAGIQAKPKLLRDLTSAAPR